MAAFFPAIDAAAPAKDLRCRTAVASTLVAALELARAGTLALDQETFGARITLHHREAEHAAGLAAE